MTGFVDALRQRISATRLLPKDAALDDPPLSRIELHALYLAGAVPVTASSQERFEQMRFVCFTMPIDS